MPRKKKGIPANIQDRRNTENAFQRQDTLPLEPVLATEPIPNPPEPVPYMEYLRRHGSDLKDNVEPVIQPLRNDDMDDLVSVPEVTDVDLADSLPLSSAMIDEYKQQVHRILARAGYKRRKKVKDTKEAKLKTSILTKLGPVVRQYKLILNPSTKRTMLLQYPSRESGQEYRAASGQKPLEIRIKPKCGLVEVDIPMNIHTNFDKAKGIEYGEALRSSRIMQQGGSYGMAGGMGVGTKPPARDSRRLIAPEGPSQDKLLENFEDADNKGHVMNKITLGGMVVPFRDGDPIYMTATFKGDICSWTKLDAMVQLRPKFDHLDALSDQGKSSSRSERNDDDSFNEKPEREARAVNMAVKSAETNDELDMYGGMSETRKLLIAIRDEPWQRLQWIDQDENESFDVYDEHLVYQDPDNAPQLISEMTNEQYLDAISCPRIDPIKQGEKVMSEGRLPTAGSTADREDEENSLDDLSDEDTGEDDDELDYPDGVTPPDLVTQIRVENAARKIGTYSLIEEAAQEHKLIQKVGTNPKLAEWTFMVPGNKDHAFYKWRLAEERLGRGINPEEDMM